MLAIRFQRTGRKNDPSFRIIVTESTRGPRSGRNVAMVGTYSPKTKAITLQKEQILHYLKHGAQPSGTVWNLLLKHGVVEGKKINVLPKKTAPKKEAPVAEAEAPSPAPEETPVEETPAEEAPKEEVVA